MRFCCSSACGDPCIDRHSNMVEEVLALFVTSQTFYFVFKHLVSA